MLGIDHIQLAAPPGSEADAREFFGQLLGLRELEKPAALRARGGAWFAIGERQQLHVGTDPQFTPARKAHPALRVGPGELEPLAERLIAAGVPVIWDELIRGQQRFYCEDPWGNRLELVA